MKANLTIRYFFSLVFLRFVLLYFVFSPRLCFLNKHIIFWQVKRQRQYKKTKSISTFLDGSGCMEIKWIKHVSSRKFHKHKVVASLAM